MIRTDKIRGLMAEKKITGIQMAKHLGITPKSFYDKMKCARFGVDDATIIIDVLDIENPEEIFFAKNVS